MRLFLLSVLLLPAFTFAEIIHVPAEYGSIQGAINAANDRDTVLVQPGVYHEQIDYISKNLVIGSRYLLTGESRYVSETIIDAGNDGRPATFEGGENGSAVLKGFTLRNGNVYHGGGVYCRRSSPTLDGLIITGNHTGEDGGGIYCTDHANPTIISTDIRDNTAEAQGGGLYCNDGSSPRLTQVTITSNTGSSGGGIYCNDEASPILTDVIVTDNEAESIAGGIYCARGSNMRMTRVLISDNFAESIRAGGIYIGLSNVRMENVTITRNRTDGEGGGVCIMGSCNPIIKNCIIWGNSPNQVYQRGAPDPAAIIEISYSDIEDGRNGVVITGNASLRWGNGNIDGDPLFEDAENGDYHLTENSPCIDAGDPDSDLDPDGTRADMGCYYFDQNQWVSDKDNSETPSGYELLKAYPNPFNASFTLEFNLTTIGQVQLEVFDVSGSKVWSRSNYHPQPGINMIGINAANWQSGSYLVRLQAGKKTDSERIICIK